MNASTVGSWSAILASSGTRLSSTMMTRSPAWPAIWATWAPGSRMLSVCRTAPMLGTPKYASRCSWLFHMNVPTGSPRPMPSRASAPASRPAFCAISA